MKTLTKLIIAVALLAGIVGLQEVCFAYTISGTLYERDGTPIKIVPAGYYPIVFLYNAGDGSEVARMVIFANGTYSFTGLSAGEYKIKPYTNVSGMTNFYLFDPPEATITLSSDIVQDFQRINRPPVLADRDPFFSFILDSYEIDEGDLFEIFIRVTPYIDPDYDKLTFTLSGNPPGMFFDEELNLLRYLPAYDHAGTYNINFIATDPYGAKAEKTFALIVNDKQPGPFSIVASPQSGPEPLWVNFKMINVPQEYFSHIITPFSVKWDFGDGGMALWPNPTHPYSKIGTHTAKVTIYDEQGNIIHQAQTTIAVSSYIPKREFYVATNGNDSNTGTIDQPWQTIQKAVKSVKPGDTVYFREGIFKLYDETYMLLFGTQEQPIIFKAYPGEHAAIDCNRTSKSLHFYRVWNTDHPQFVILDGLEIYNTDEWALVIAGYNITVRNCVIHDSIAEAIKIYSSANNVLIENCTFFNTGENAIDTVGGRQLTIRHNTFQGGPGVYPAFMNLKGGTTRDRVYGNIFRDVFYSQAKSWLGAVQIGGYSSLDNKKGLNEHMSSIVHDNLFYNISGMAISFKEAVDSAAFNNTIIRKELSDHYFIQVIENLTDKLQEFRPCKNIAIANNIVVAEYAPTKFFIVNPGSEVGFRSNYNIWWVSGGEQGGSFDWLGQRLSFSDYKGLSGQDQNSVFNDSLFVDANNLDFHLTADSPAKDSGNSVFSSYFDLDGTPRPQGTAPDIGAYEYQGTQPILPGDIDGDGDVDLQDLLIVAQNYGLTSGFDARADCVGDGKIDLQDLLLVAMHYGERIQ